MMLKRLMVTTFAAACVFAFLLRYHFVCVDHSVLVIRKTQLSLQDTFVDVTSWHGNEWNEHQLLSEAVLSAD